MVDEQAPAGRKSSSHAHTLPPEGTISTAAPTATTLQDFLKVLPGELKIAANFPEATVEITQFERTQAAPDQLCYRVRSR